jgi:hypothetical protein
MTERELILLGELILKSEEIREHDEDESYYYALDIVDGITFITPVNEEIKDGNWYVDFFNTDPLVRFHDFEEVQGLINQLKKAIVNGK